MVGLRFSKQKQTPLRMESNLKQRDIFNPQILIMPDIETVYKTLVIISINISSVFFVIWLHIRCCIL